MLLNNFSKMCASALALVLKQRTGPTFGVSTNKNVLDASE